MVQMHFGISPLSLIPNTPRSRLKSFPNRSSNPPNTPLINYSPTSDVPWIVNADSALINQSQPLVKLRGHVRAISSEGFSGNDTEIRTEYMELHPENYTAETDERVQIRIGARSLTATGMLASLKEDQLLLKANVNGVFLP